jgi:hypothetical protein
MFSGGEERRKIGEIIMRQNKWAGKCNALLPLTARIPSKNWLTSG